MNEPYSELREHTLNDIKQVIDFYRLEITDDPETHNTIEGSLAETIAEWVPMDFEQIEISSTSIGDDLIISVLYTNTSEIIDDQFMVVHNENDMFDNSGALLSSMLEKTDLSGFEWNYDFTVDSMGKLDDVMLSFDDIELEFNDMEIEFDKKDLSLKYDYTYTNPTTAPLTKRLNDVLTELLDDDGVVRSKPFII